MPSSTGFHGRATRVLRVLIASLLPLLVGGADSALAIPLDPAISYYYPQHGWPSQAYTSGHNGWGPNNNPTYYGAVDTDYCYWPSVGGSCSAAGENGCAPNRSPNMNVAEERSEDSTTDEPQLPDWPSTSGLLMTYVGCDVSEAGNTQFTTWVVEPNGGPAGGATWHFGATSTQCASIGLTFPCGDWATLAQLTISWWNTHTDVQRRKLLLHEWGHAWNLGDYCGTFPAISKNGTPSCPWPDQTKYYDLDDKGLYLICEDQP